MLGKGSFGEVRVCQHIVSKDIRAVKSISKSRMGDDSFKNFKTEIESLRKLDHPNILKLYEVFQDEGAFYVITEKIDGGELFDLII
jgi:calcium-dependent protein kinase